MPALVLHSLEVTHVPVRPEPVLQASLGNWTTENRPTGLGRPEVRQQTAVTFITMTGKERCNTLT